MSGNRFLVRADAGRSIGAGHVVRCLTLADLLRARGGSVTFALRDNTGSSIDRVVASGHKTAVLPDREITRSLLEGPLPERVQRDDAELVQTLATDGFDTVIVDHYGLDATWEKAVRSTATRIVAIDDLANRTHDADVLVDQNWYGPDTSNRYEGLLPTSCLQLLGPRYAMLQQAYAEARVTSSPSERSTRRVLVSFGGSDPTAETAKVVEALAAPEFTDVAVDVVLGNAGVLTQTLRQSMDGLPDARIHIGVPSLAALLSRADLAIGASGAGTWERICLGVPAIVTATSRAHSGVTKALAEAGLTTWAGIGGEVTADRYRELASEALRHPAPSAIPLVDGHGAARVAEALVPASGLLELRPASSLDLPQFLGVDPGGPPTAGRQLDGPVVWRGEQDRFEEDAQDPDRLRLIAMLARLPIGTVEASLSDRLVTARFALADFAARPGLAQLLAEVLSSATWTIGHNGLAVRAEPARFDPPSDQHPELSKPYGSVVTPLGTILGVDHRPATAQPFTNEVP